MKNVATATTPTYVVAGMKRSGTTWLYNIVRYILLNAGRRVFAGYSHEPIRAPGADAIVVKSHQWHPALAEVTEVAFFCHRDIRDCVASYVRHGVIKDDPESCAEFARELLLPVTQDWGTQATRIAYQQIRHDKPALVEEVGEALGIEVDADIVLADVAKLDLIVRTEEDPLTCLWPGHITDGRIGSHDETLGPAAIEAVERVVREDAQIAMGKYPWVIEDMWASPD